MRSAFAATSALSVTTISMAGAVLGRRARQGLLRRAEIAGAVIDQRDNGSHGAF